MKSHSSLQQLLHPRRTIVKVRVRRHEKPLKSIISYSAVSGSSQSVLTGKPRTPEPQGKPKAPKPAGKTKSTNPPGKAKTSRSSFFVSAEVHNEDGASEEAAELRKRIEEEDQEDWVEEESVEDEELSFHESQVSECVLDEEPSREAPQTRYKRMDKRLSGFEDDLREVKDLLKKLAQGKKRKAEKKDRGREKRSKARKDNSKQKKKAW